MKKLFIAIICLTLIFLGVPPTQADDVKDAAENLLKGKILLQVESKGEAWYVDPDSSERIYMGRPSDAFLLMRGMGMGISNANLAKIPVEGDNAVGDKKLRDRLAGKVLLQVEENGEAWYVNPETKKRIFLGKPSDAFSIMKKLAIGVSNKNVVKLKVKTSLKDHVIPTRHINVLMTEQSTSTQSGLAVLYDFGVKTKVEIKLLNPPVGVPQPAHIHTGTCVTMGAIKYPLTSLTNGKSETMLNVSLDQILLGLPLLINVHKSATDISTSVACGSIGANTAPGQREREREHEEQVNRAFPVIKVTMTERNGSGRNGKAELYDLGAQTKVAITANSTAATGTLYAYIKQGNCGSSGAVKYALNPVINNKSESVIAFSLNRILQDLPLSIELQTSSSSTATSTAIACGNILLPNSDDTESDDSRDDSNNNDNGNDDANDDVNDDMNDDAGDDIGDDAGDDAGDDVGDDAGDDVEDDSPDGNQSSDSAKNDV